MTSKLSPATPRSKLQRGSGLEMDRNSPTAKNAAGMPGENTPKKRTPLSRGAELNQVQEELAKIKEQLALTEKSKTNLLQDLARSKRQVEDLTTKLQEASKVSQQDRQRVEEMEHASFTAAEDWQVEVEVLKQQYEEAVLELEASKQAMESLQHELIVCVEAKSEAVRLAGEAMNAAESTAKRVEELSAELLALKRANVVTLNSASAMPAKSFNSQCDEDEDKGATHLLDGKEVELERAQQEVSNARSELDLLKQSLAVAQESERQFADLMLTFEHVQRELEISQGAEIESGVQLCSLSSELKQAMVELAESKEVERRLELELSDLNGKLDNSKLELAAVKQSEEGANVAAANVRTKYEELVADVERLREREAAAGASVAAVSAELKEVQEKLAQATIQGLTLVTFLESLKAEMNVDRWAQVMELKEKEALANAKAEALASQFMAFAEANQKEILRLNDALARSNAAMESLQVESERQRSELVTLLAKESIANENAQARAVEIQRAQAELEEWKRQEYSSAEKASALSLELVITQKELSLMKESEVVTQKKLSLMKEREVSSASRVASLIGELEEKHGEVSELSRKITSSDSEAAALKIKLKEAEEHVAYLKDREYGMHSKAAALSVALASLTEESESRVTDLTKNNEAAMAKAAALSNELEKTRSDLEEALSAANAAKGDADKLREGVHLAISEKEQARQGEAVAIGEAAKSKESLLVALAMAQRAEDELKRALETAEAAEQKVLERVQEETGLKELLRTTQTDVHLARDETEAVRHELHAALLDSDNLMKELIQEREDAQNTKEEVLSLKREALMIKEQAKTASEEAETELLKLKEDLDRVTSEEEKAQVACMSADARLQEALKELEALKLKSLHVHGEDEQENEEQPGGVLEDVSREEFIDLTTKLQETELQLANALALLEASSTHTESMSKELQVVMSEKEASEKALLEVHQVLADTEKAKSNMEAEIQRLLDDSKQWQTAKDVIDIPVHTEANGRGLPLECREDKPQPEPMEEALDSGPSLPKVSDDQKRDVVMRWVGSEGNSELGHSEELPQLSLQKESELGHGSEELPRLSLQKEESLECEDGSVKDEGALQDDAVSMPAKKKKKNLLGRLGTLLEKKKHSQQQTP